MEIEWKGKLRTNNWKMMKKVISKNSIFIHKEIGSEKDEKKSWSLALSSRWPFLMIWKVSQVMIKLRNPSRRLIKNIKRQNKCVRVFDPPLHNKQLRVLFVTQKNYSWNFSNYFWLSKRFKFASNSWCERFLLCWWNIFICMYIFFVAHILEWKILEQKSLLNCLMQDEKDRNIQLIIT